MCWVDKAAQCTVGTVVCLLVYVNLGLVVPDDDCWGEDPSFEEWGSVVSEIALNELKEAFRQFKFATRGE